MLNTVDNDLIDALAETMETLAFLSLGPTEERSAPADAVLCTICFNGVLSGRFCMVAPEALGCYLAANVLGTDPTDPSAQERATDSLRELMNVACGAYCTRRKATGKVELELPQSVDLAGDGEWELALANPGVQIFDVDGHTIAVWLEELT